VVCTVTVGTVRSTEVLSDAGVVVMGTLGVTMLHPQGLGDPKLPPSPEEVPLSSKESSRAVCNDGDPLCTIPTNKAPESPSLGEVGVNFRLLKQMVSPGARPTLVGLLPIAMKESYDGFGE
jgi:hypothetical protein